MHIDTTRFGVVDVSPDAVITTPQGLVGFPSARCFALIEHEPGHPFQWLQSLDDPSLAFLVIDPYRFFPDYEVEMSEDKAETLGIRDSGETQVLTTVTIRRSSGEVTTNLLGPLVVGLSTRRAVQVVLDGDRYTTRHLLSRFRPVNGTAAISMMTSA